jgi:hypothetical protein
MEMEQKALEKILMCVKLESNMFKARWYIMPDNISWNYVVFCKFILNNEEYEFNFPLPSRYCGKDKIIDLVRTSIIDKMSGIMTRDLFMENLKTIRDIYNI